MGQAGEQVKVGRAMERDAFALAFDDQPHGHALNTTGRETSTDFFPEQLRDIKAVQAIEDAACFLSSYQSFIDLARVGQSILNGLFGDFVEHQSVDGHFGFEDFEKVPRNGLSFAVFVRRQVELVHVFQKIFEFINLFLLVGRHDVDRGEILINIDSQVSPRLRFEFFG